MTSTNRRTMKRIMNLPLGNDAKRFIQNVLDIPGATLTDVKHSRKTSNISVQIEAASVPTFDGRAGLLLASVTDTGTIDVIDIEVRLPDNTQAAEEHWQVTPSAEGLADALLTLVNALPRYAELYRSRRQQPPDISTKLQTDAALGKTETLVLPEDLPFL